MIFHPGRRVDALVTVRNLALATDVQEYRRGQVQATNGPDVLVVFDKPFEAMVHMILLRNRLSSELEAIRWAWVPETDCVVV